jgi:hypothetical protein
MRRPERPYQRGLLPFLRTDRSYAALSPFPDNGPDGLTVQHAFSGIPQRIRFHGVDFFPQHDALALVGLFRVGVYARVSEPARPAPDDFPSRAIRSCASRTRTLFTALSRFARSVSIPP